MGFLTGKRVLIVGVASKLSIASGIAAAMHREGAELAFTYQNDKLKGRVEEFASGWGSGPELCFPCDVANDEDIAKVFEALSQKWDGLDCIVHSVGFAPGDQLNGDFTDVTTREGFKIAHDISAYSFVALAKAGREMMKGRNGSLLTLSYLGAERTMPNYNVMGMAKASLKAGVRYLAGSLGPEGTRVNCISAGPIRWRTPRRWGWRCCVYCRVAARSSSTARRSRAWARPRYDRFDVRCRWSFRTRMAA